MPQTSSNSSVAIPKQKPVIAIIDNSISFTGAFKCALSEATILQQQFHFIFIIPTGSTVRSAVLQQGFTCYELPMIELGKSVKKLAAYGPQLFQNAMRLLKIVRAEKVDVLQANDFYNLLGVAVKGLGFKGKLITYVRFLPLAVPTPLRRLWVGLAHRYADAVVAVSDAVLKQLPPHPKNIRIYDAVELPEKLPSGTVQQPNAAVTFLYLANYIRGKGQERAIKAFHDVAKQNNQVILKFAGGDMGLQKNKLFKKELEHYTQTHKLTAQVQFAAFQPDIEQAIKEADVVLNFAESESFSMTCAEASYYGVPVIATRCGGPEELIVHQTTGLLVANQYSPEMATAMQALAASPQLRRQYGAAAAHYLKTHFTAAQFNAQFTALLQRIGIPHEN